MSGPRLSCCSYPHRPNRASGTCIHSMHGCCRPEWRVRQPAQNVIGPGHDLEVRRARFGVDAGSPEVRQGTRHIQRRSDQQSAIDPASAQQFSREDSILSYSRCGPPPRQRRTVHPGLPPLGLGPSLAEPGQLTAGDDHPGCLAGVIDASCMPEPIRAPAQIGIRLSRQHRCKSAAQHIDSTRTLQFSDRLIRKPAFERIPQAIGHHRKRPKVPSQTTPTGRATVPHRNRPGTNRISVAPSGDATCVDREAEGMNYIVRVAPPASANTIQSPGSVPHLLTPALWPIRNLVEPSHNVRHKYASPDSSQRARRAGRTERGPRSRVDGR